MKTMNLRFLPATAHPDASRILSARALRAFGDGFVSILLPVYLLRLGFSPLEVGLLTTTTLLGSAAATMAVGLVAHRFRLHVLLVLSCVLMIFTGLGFAWFESFWPLLIVAFVGTLNPSSGDVSMFLPLEHAALAHSVADQDRTSLFVRYSLAGALAGALGTLGAGAPDLLVASFGLAPMRTIQAMFIAYGLLGFLSLFAYWNVGQTQTADEIKAPAPLGPSRGIVYRLAALFSVDAFGGGFIVQSMLALWLIQRFDLSLGETAAVFFWSNVFSAISYFVAAPLARRFGLINTMVYTHLPSSLFLVIVPFVSQLWLVLALLFARSLLSQMDVPTRNSYVMAVVTPAERPAAASVTAVPRSLAAALSPSLAGVLLSLTSFGWPLLFAGALKIGYDLALLYMFRHVLPPEERVERGGDS
jgi:MFS family permease